MKRKKFVIVAVALVVLITSIIALLIWRQAGNRVTEAPQFDSVLPSQTDISELGGWNKFSPPGSEPYYVFTDKIDGIPIRVSQQPLPESFKKDINTQITELAKQYSAAARLDVGGSIVYIGTSSQGPQSVIFTKKELLILIKSDGKIADAAWSAYIASLD